MEQWKSAGSDPAFARALRMEIRAGLALPRRELRQRGSAPNQRLSLAIAAALGLAVPGLARTIAPPSAGTHRHAALQPQGVRTVNPDNGISSVPSRHSVDRTVDTLEALLRAKGVKLFSVVDHSGQAKAAGLEMRPTRLLIFGNAKAGTPLMIASPSIAIDLPLKLLVWEDAVGKVWISYNTAEYLERRHQLPHELVPTLAAVEALAAKAGE